MIATIAESPEFHVADLPDRFGKVRMVRVSDRLWRALGADGLILGHLRATGAGSQVRYEALRLCVSAGCFRAIGTFWRPDEAVECLRLSR
jgi:hypothetical protein